MTAEENQSSHCPKGNRYGRRILSEAAHAAGKKQGSHFQNLFRRFLPKLGYNGAIWVVAHRLARLAWKILHYRVSYVEQGQETNPRAKKRRAQKLAHAAGQRGTFNAIHPRPALYRRGFNGAVTRCRML